MKIDRAHFRVRFPEHWKISREHSRGTLWWDTLMCSVQRKTSTFVGISVDIFVYTPMRIFVSTFVRERERERVCGSIRKLEKAVAVRNSLLERFSGKFRRCWKMIPRFSGSAKCYLCQGVCIFVSTFVREFVGQISRFACSVLVSSKSRMLLHDPLGVHP